MAGELGGIPPAAITHVGDSQLVRYAAEPQSSWRKVVGDAASTVGQFLGRAAGLGGSALGIEPQYATLIQEQIHQQTQMQLVSLVSNVEKSKHETQMSAIRNVRAG